MMAVPFVVIIGFILYYSITLATGEEIVLKVMPIDPVDLFRGNYVDLGYRDISNLDLNEVGADKEFLEGEVLYATLSKKEEFWTVDMISHKKIFVNENEVCMKGKVRSVRGDRVGVEWGIESFFLPAEKAKEVESSVRRGNVSSVVSVDESCNSVLKALIVGNETVKTK